MSRFSNKRHWHVFGPKERMQIEGAQKLTLRAEKECRAYIAYKRDFKDEILCGMGIGEFECSLFTRGFVRVESEGRVWMSVEIREQGQKKTSDLAFTTLDRPSPLSPEMRAVHEMIRANEIQRDKERLEMEQTIDRRLQHIQRTGPARPDPAETAKAVRKKPVGSAHDAEEQPSGNDQSPPDPGNADSGNSGSNQIPAGGAESGQ